MSTPIAIAYYSSDALGTASEFSDTGGLSLGRYDSNPFGDGATTKDLFAANPFAFTGEHITSRTGGLRDASAA